MGVHNIQSKDAFQEELTLSTNETGGSVVVLDAFATWCGPCKVIAPTIAQWSELSEFKHVKFVKLDVDEVSDVAQELGIRAMPTFIIFKNGVKVDQVVGANPTALKDTIKKIAGEAPKEE